MGNTVSFCKIGNGFKICSDNNSVFDNKAIGNAKDGFLIDEGDCVSLSRKKLSLFEMLSEMQHLSNIVILSNLNSAERL